MKIRSVTLHNLNSLEGKWIIDFTHQAYVDDGIFVISGPTGAGKTTIMDAICLALYGQTPRLQLRKANIADIMSRGKSECGAEVVFETRDGLFRSECKYSKKSNQFNKAIYNISDANSKKTKIKQQDITKLDFLQFKRAVMLAQGDFTAFLNATDKERDSILEKITGSDIYRNISRTVFAMCKDACQRTDSLSANIATLNILSDEEEKEITATLEKFKGELEIINTKNKEYERLITWRANLERLEKNFGILKNQQTNLQADEDNFKTQKATLQRADAAEPVHRIYNIWRDKIKENEEINRKIKAANDDIAVREKLKNDTSNKLSIIITQISRLNYEINEKKPIFGKIRELDREIAHKDKEFITYGKLFRQIENKYLGANETLKQIMAKKALCEQEYATICQWLQDNSMDETLDIKLASLKAGIGQNARLAEQSKKYAQEIKASASSLAALVKNIALQQKLIDEKKLQINEYDKSIAEIAREISDLLNGKDIDYYNNEKDILTAQKIRIENTLSYEAQRAKLQTDEPCPLCGSTRHPYVEHMPPISDPVDEKLKTAKNILDNVKKYNDKLAKAKDIKSARERELAALEKDFFASNNEKKSQEGRITELRDNEKELLEEIARNEAELRKEIALFSVIDANEGLDKVMEKLRGRSAAWKTAAERREIARGKMESIRGEMESATALAGEFNRQFEEARANLEKLAAELEGLRQARKNEYGDLSPDGEEAKLSSALDKNMKDKSSLEKDVAAIETALAGLHGMLAEMRRGLEDNELQQKKFQEEYQLALDQSPFESEKDFLAATMDDAQKDALRKKARELEKRKMENSGALKDCQDNLDQEKDKNLTAKTLEELRDALALSGKRGNELAENIGALRNRIENNRQAGIKARELKENLEKWSIQKERFGKVNKLIGSADGAAFSKMAQKITFGMVVSYANEHLARLSDRYLLVPTKDETLNVNVLDKFQAGEIRPVGTLSGGETFQASLALALGLSRIASENSPIDSLFLDEGFGTLDEDSLRSALEALASLRNEGKMIGVISHVPEVKNRIATRIEVIPQNNGASALSGPGCSRLA